MELGFLPIVTTVVLVVIICALFITGKSFGEELERERWMRTWERIFGYRPTSLQIPHLGTHDAERGSDDTG